MILNLVHDLTSGIPALHILRPHDHKPLRWEGFEPRLQLEGVSGGKNRGFWWVVSDLRGGLDADERVEVADACL